MSQPHLLYVDPKVEQNTIFKIIPWTKSITQITNTKMKEEINFQVKESKHEVAIYSPIACRQSSLQYYILMVVSVSEGQSAQLYYIPSRKLISSFIDDMYLHARTFTR